MAKQKNGVNKSEEIRKLLGANPRISAKDVSTALGEKGIKISPKLYYLVKGKMLAKQAHKKKAQKMAAKVAASTGTGGGDALSMILRVKSLAREVGGMKRLQSLVEAMNE